LRDLNFSSTCALSLPTFPSILPTSASISLADALIWFGEWLISLDRVPI
jgi:hypothetical protein